MSARKSLTETTYLKTIETTDPEKHILCTVYQHPFGIISIYLAAFVCIVFVALLSGGVLPSITGETSRTMGGIALGTLLIGLIITLILIVATIVYRKSKLTITDRSVVQVLQKGVLIRKISQISLANIEDVTSEQKGVFATYLGYGVLNIETAGEQANFQFGFCPNPHRVAKIILDAKDDFLSHTGQTGDYRNQARPRPKA